MSIRKIIVTFAAAAALTAVAAPAASASISQELAAGRKVERTATKYYPRYSFVANCDQETRTYFWCSVIGRSGDCFLQGNASVRVRYSARGTDWWTTLRGLNRDCY